MLALSRGSPKKDCPTAPQQGPPQQKYKTTKETQCNLVKTFCKRFQDRKRQINKMSTPSEDDSFKELNKFFSGFESMMVKDSYDSLAWLVPTDEAIINEVFIDGFHVLYKVQIGKLKTQALFDMLYHLSFTAQCNNSKFYQPAERLSQQMATA